MKTESMMAATNSLGETFNPEVEKLQVFSCLQRRVFQRHRGLISSQLDL